MARLWLAPKPWRSDRSTTSASGNASRTAAALPSVDALSITIVCSVVSRAACGSDARQPSSSSRLLVLTREIEIAGASLTE